uniref:Midasin n=1 Tax=Mesocestoides corti TaxID=53468 RepID=A0A5K3FAK3_MESCO
MFGFTESNFCLGLQKVLCKHFYLVHRMSTFAWYIRVHDDNLKWDSKNYEQGDPDHGEAELQGLDNELECQDIDFAELFDAYEPEFRACNAAERHEDNKPECQEHDVADHHTVNESKCQDLNFVEHYDNNKMECQKLDVALHHDDSKPKFQEHDVALHHDNERACQEIDVAERHDDIERAIQDLDLAERHDDIERGCQDLGLAEHHDENERACQDLDVTERHDHNELECQSDDAKSICRPISRASSFDDWIESNHEEIAAHYMETSDWEEDLIPLDDSDEPIGASSDGEVDYDSDECAYFMERWIDELQQLRALRCDSDDSVNEA